MKKILVTILAFSFFELNFAFACGIKNPNSPRTAVDVEQDLLKKVAGKNLSCQGNGGEMDSQISIYAKYRCLNSPVFGNLKFDLWPGGFIRISKITEDERGVLTVYMGDFAEPEICTVK